MTPLNNLQIPNLIVRTIWLPFATHHYKPMARIFICELDLPPENLLWIEYVAKVALAQYDLWHYRDIATVLASNLMQKVTTSLRISINNKFCFTDSTIALHYIKSDTNMLQVYVANRIAQIQRTSKAQNWLHVANPSCWYSFAWTIRERIYSFWFVLARAKFPKNWSIIMALIRNITSIWTDFLETRKITLVTPINKVNMPVIEKYSCFIKLQRVMAYVLRIVHTCKRENKKSTSPLSANEITRSRQIFREIQREEFKEEVTVPKNEKSPSKGSRLNKLDPFIDCYDYLSRIDVP